VNTFLRQADKQLKIICVTEYNLLQGNDMSLTSYQTAVSPHIQGDLYFYVHLFLKTDAF